MNLKAIKVDATDPDSAYRLYDESFYLGAVTASDMISVCNSVTAQENAAGDAMIEAGFAWEEINHEN